MYIPKEGLDTPPQVLILAEKLRSEQVMAIQYFAAQPLITTEHAQLFVFGLKPLTFEAIYMAIVTAIKENILFSLFRAAQMAAA